MRRISIVVNSSLAKRQFLCTPLFDILRSDPKNEITIFAQPKDFSEKINFKGIKIRTYEGLLWLRKLGIKRSSIVFFAYIILGIKKSDIIILISWMDEELTAVLKLAKKFGIPTLFIQEGMLNAWEKYLVDIYPTKILAWGEAARSAYIERGIAPERIEVTGQPRFDWYYKLKKNDVFSKINGKKTLLYATQPLWKEPVKFENGEDIIIKTFDIIYNTCRKLDLQLVCKLHPSDKPDYYRKDDVIILEETGLSPKNYKKWYCNTGYDPSIDDIKRLGYILLASDIVVTMFSTVGLEALILNKPVIFLDIAGFVKKDSVSRVLTKKASNFFVNNKEDFESAVIKYLENPHIYDDFMKKVVYDFAYKQDGKASERVVLAIEGLLSKNARA